MKHHLLTTIAAVVLVGCGESQSPEPPTAKAPAISIHDAAREGNIEAVKRHLASGAGVNAKADNGLTPLHNAALKGRKEIAELLIAEGADVNVKSVVGSTPLDWAVINNETEIADVLRKHGGKSGANDSIHVATRVGNIEAVKKHLATGTDVNAKNVWGHTPLHRAAQGGSKEIAELLIAKGADVNAKGKVGATPLDFAIFRNHPETADLLRKHGGKTGEELSIAHLTPNEKKILGVYKIDIDAIARKAGMSVDLAKSVAGSNASISIKADKSVKFSASGLYFGEGEKLSNSVFGKWSINGKELQINTDKIRYYRVEDSGNLMPVAYEENNNRIEIPKWQQTHFVKVKE